MKPHMENLVNNNKKCSIMGIITCFVVTIEFIDVFHLWMVQCTLYSDLWQVPLPPELPGVFHSLLLEN